MSTQLGLAIPTLTLPSKSWMAVVSALQITALSVTIFRVYHRFKTSHMWWDDYVVVMVFILDALGLVNVWYGYSHHCESHSKLVSSTLLTPGFVFSPQSICFT
ncbi:hypothetical protein K443DRAFT_624818 [Laccaria amethystina LaAM-08-1]|uniref:Unplaced genomic scaffold K443scaffold_118, whole genome shotgun sequence n=1 Tax=Laccaria amethystina LaAM-08-1 TaxID=1095629 RepID=A0A0C9WNH8_9AGAR|nr:hypothetical protein K443DRAFT_624818 [Laccaria amethystina LaAM-08-1]